MFLIPCLEKMLFQFLDEDERYYVQFEWNKIKNPLFCASKCGYLDLLQFGLKRYELTSLHLDIAIFYGHLHILKSCPAHMLTWGAYVVAITQGHFKVIKWLYKMKRPYDAFVTAVIAQHGEFKMLKWVRRRGCEWDSRTTSYCASNGNLKILKWAVQNRCETDSYLSLNAAESGNLKMLKWLHKKGCLEFNTQTFVYAVRSGNFAMLKWLYKTGCEWDSRVCEVAAGREDLRTLKWAIKKGCPFDSKACLVAAKREQTIFSSTDVIDFIENLRLVKSD